MEPQLENCWSRRFSGAGKKHTLFIPEQTPEEGQVLLRPNRPYSLVVLREAAGSGSQWGRPLWEGSQASGVGGLREALMGEVSPSGPKGGPHRPSCAPAMALAHTVVLSCVPSHSAGAPAPSLWWPSTHDSHHLRLWTRRPGAPVPSSPCRCSPPGQWWAQGSARPRPGGCGLIRLHLDLISRGGSESRGLPLSSPGQSPDGREMAGICSASCGARRCVCVSVVELAIVEGGRENQPGIPRPAGLRLLPGPTGWER